MIITEYECLLPKGSSFDYEYFIKDHPPVGGQVHGNTRITVKDSAGTAIVMQEDHYYGTFEKAGEFIENAVNVKTILSPTPTQAEKIINETSLFFNLNNYLPEPEKPDDIQK